MTQLKYQPSKSSADHFPSAGHHMVLKQSKWGETERKEPKGKNTHLIPVVYALKLFKIYGLQYA